MKKLLLILAVFLLLLPSCKQEVKEEIPADVIPREQMIDIVVDAWFMESVIHNTIKEYVKLEPVSVSMYAEFFEEHGISKEQFVHSIEYYMRDDGVAEAFVEECSQRFEERQEDFTGVAAPASQPQ